MEGKEWEKFHRAFWEAYVSREEKRVRNPEKRVYDALVWREISFVLPPRGRILDVGAGPGSYSLPLARKGFEVHHLDLAWQMVRRAKRKAAKEKLSGLHFVVAKIDALPYPEGFFDLVLALDAPLSYAPFPPAAAKELVRVAKERLVVSVVNRLGQVPVGLGWEAFLGKDFRFTRAFWERGVWEPPSSLARWARLPGLRPFVFPPLRAFYPEELVSLFQGLGCEVERLVAVGTLARLIGRRALKRVLASPRRLEEFLTLAARFDARPEVQGVGAKEASGLLAVVRK